MNDVQVEIARCLATHAFNRQRVTYPELARAIHWPHPTGRGLGNHLWEVLHFTHDAGLPCLTSILCKAGTLAPPDEAMAYIREAYGAIDVSAEQDRVFAYPWDKVSALAFAIPEAVPIDFSRSYATRVWGFDPERWGMSGFRFETTRDAIFDAMGNTPIYVVYFCSQHSEAIEGHDGAFTIQPDDVARVLGIVEVQPEKASHDTHTAADAVSEMVRLWGEPRWAYGLAISRAWEVVERPWTREVLPDARSASWEATVGIVPLSEQERRLIQQYHFRELPVYGRELRPVAFALREPMHTTYLAICADPHVLAKTSAPKGTKLVKIGVSGDTARRLRDLNDHHFAKIFGLSFSMYATHRWANQEEALARESLALEWALQHATEHASGEFFYMSDEQVTNALIKVKPPKTVK